MSQFARVLIYISLAYFYFTGVAATGPTKSKEFPTTKPTRIAVAYSWKGRIVGKPANWTNLRALCLAADPDTLQLVYMRPIARRCPDMEEQGLRDKDRWTTWEIRGMFHAPDRETFPKFTGFIRHVALDACMLYTLDTGFMADESPRGFLMLEPCSEVQEAYKKMTWTALDDANQRFLNTIQVPLGTETSDPNSKPWMRWVSPASEDNTMLLDADTGDTKDMIDLKDNTRTLLSKATVCGGYMAMGQPGDGVWSLLADTELKEGEPWQWGCGSRTVEFDPSFFLDKF